MVKTRTKLKREKNIKRCAFSYKRIDNQEVVLTKYAVDYVKKMGYKVIEPKTSYRKRKTAVLTIFSLLFLLPIISAGLFTYNINSTPNILLLGLMFLVAIAFYFLGFIIFSGLISVVIGCLILFNEGSIILGVLFIIAGIMSWFWEDRK